MQRHTPLKVKAKGFKYEQKTPPNKTAGKNSSTKSRIPINLDNLIWDLEED